MWNVPLRAILWFVWEIKFTQNLPSIYPKLTALTQLLLDAKEVGRRSPKIYRFRPTAAVAPRGRAGPGGRLEGRRADFWYSFDRPRLRAAIMLPASERNSEHANRRLTPARAIR